MTKITTQVRATVRQILADSREYDAETMRISRAGIVSATKDADKTFNGLETARYFLGHVSDMVTAEGARREGR